MALTDEQRDRYARHIVLDGFGTTGQERLCASRMLIVGAGGLGSPVALYLAAAGVGSIGVIDNDTVSLSNLQRQILHSEKTIGIPKVDSAAASMRAINSGITVETFNRELTAQDATKIIEPYDIVCDCTDGISSKLLVNDACVALGKPFVHASVLGFYGEIMTYVPDAGPCYRCFLPNEPDQNRLSTCATKGIIGALAGIIGSIEALEAIKYVTGTGDLLCGKLLTYDALSNDFEIVDIARDPTCAACGKHTQDAEGKSDL
jgi:molybdopterin/thiamine biosynthesis adenylyltransferase